jgi:hypothetical protein
MLITFGQHNGKSVELVILKHPEYVKWVLNQVNPKGPLVQIQNEMYRLLIIFDQKPFLTSCSGRDCTNPVTRTSVYKDNLRLMFWCDLCSPDLIGTQSGRIQIIETYVDALNHVGTYCENRKSDYRDLIRSLASAKGLGKRVGEEQAKEFFR